MIKRSRVIGFFPLLLSCMALFLPAACNNPGEFETSPLSIKNCILSRTGEKESFLIKRYCAGNRRWELIYEKGSTFAVRKEKTEGFAGQDLAEIYESSEDGFYLRQYPAGGLLKTRVIIAFDEPYGSGDNDIVTVTDSSDKTLDLKMYRAETATGFSSCLIIRGKYCAIEIFEESPDIARTFTATTLKELAEELDIALSHAKELSLTGLVPAPELYPTQQEKPFFTVSDGKQPGTFMASAGVVINKEGILYIRAVKTTDNSEIPGPDIKRQSTRIAGFDPENGFVFPYSSLITISNGESGTTEDFEARFELMFQGRDRSLVKIDELTRMVISRER